MITELSNPLIRGKEAIVHTASIEVRVLTINGKQLTLSVFRQIPYGVLVNRLTGKFNGTAWGWVNYFWTGAEEYDDIGVLHLHVVWQKGNTLYRDLVPGSYPFRHIPSDVKRSVHSLEQKISNERRLLQGEEKALSSPSEWIRKSAEGRIPQHRDAIRKYLSEIEFLNGELKDDYNKQAHDNWGTMINQLRSLPQLFIAV